MTLHPWGLWTGGAGAYAPALVDSASGFTGADGVPQYGRLMDRFNNQNRRPRVLATEPVDVLKRVDHTLARSDTPSRGRSKEVTHSATGKPETERPEKTRFHKNRFGHGLHLYLLRGRAELAGDI